MKKRVLLLVLAVLALTFVLVSCGHEHDFQEKEVITAPTCDVAGKTLYACECGETEEREVAATGHTGGEEQVKEPTCRDDGYTFKVCSVCNAEYDKKDEKPSGAQYHKFDEVKMVTPVDCSKVPMQNGIKRTVCSLCGEIDPNGKSELVIAQHDYETTRTEPTCSAPGSITKVCKNCGAPGPTEEIPQLEHTKEFLEEVKANCTEAGFKSYVCTVCNAPIKEETEPATGHNWNTDVVLTKEPTCVTPGYKYYGCTNEGCLGENLIPGEVISPPGHDFDHNDVEYTVVVDPTCITEGTITPICKVCNELLDTETDEEGKSYVKVLPPTGEHYVTNVVGDLVPATCHEAAYRIVTCTSDANCTESKKVEEGEKLDHKFPESPTAVIAPKCNADGYDLYVCTICGIDTTADSTCEYGCVKKDNFTTAPHTPSDKIGSVESTCCEQAYDIYYCEVCQSNWNKYYPVEEKPLLAHGTTHDGKSTWLETDDVTAPTCTSEGYTIYKCKSDDNCTVTDKQDYTRRIEHPFTEYVDGRLVCAVCNVTYRDVTTYKKDSVASGTLQIDVNTSLNWELKGYESPKAAEVIAAGSNYEYVVGGDKLDITNGIIKLSTDAQAEYTITVEYANGESKIFDKLSGDIYFDLYVNNEGEQNGIAGNVAKVKITSTQEATVAFFAYEG